MDKELSVLENLIGYTFSNKKLLEEALTHPSFANETGSEADNQRLEFLGDSILGFIVGRELYNMFPESDEGELTRMRASLVDKESLAHFASSISLGDFLMLGRGELKGGGKYKKSILADAFEALIAVLYLDGGIAAADKFIKTKMLSAISKDEFMHRVEDFKTELQERTQSDIGIIPVYELLEATGPDHDKSYRVALLIDGKIVAEGEGKSKKGAQQEAAKNALTKLYP
ncbi:MAG: ribonuclease III [Desulfuromonadales bacterium]|nr:ribonuclease III [Desulfuromonadales bacterium]